jgi:hypothetical protein
MRELVELRAETHPADAIPYRRRFVEEALRIANRDAYRVSVRWLVALRTANERAGTAKDFTSYVDKLREANSRRPAFLDELRKHVWRKERLRRTGLIGKYRPGR